MMPARLNEKVLIRADGSRRLGLGHIVRCLALAEGLKSIGFEPVFAIRAEDLGVVERVQRNGYAVERLPALATFPEDLSFMQRLIGACQSNPLVVTDQCSDDALADVGGYRAYLEGLKATGASLVTIDDLHTFPFPSNIVLNPHFGAEHLPYQQSPGTTYLLGPRYFLFGREFRDSIQQARVIRQEATRVAVSLGGGDLHHTVEKVLNALFRLRERRGLEVRVVMGLEEWPPEVKSLADRFEGGCVLAGQAESLLPLLLWCDLAVIGGGLTKYEAAVTSTPSLILSQREHQWVASEQFCQVGTALHIGRDWETGEEEISLALDDVLSNYSQRQAMSTAGKGLVDGRGVERVVEEVVDHAQVQGGQPLEWERSAGNGA